MTEYTIDGDISKVLNLYLYGTSYIPDMPENRLRDIDPFNSSSITNYTLKTDVDTVSYMQDIGRDARLSDIPAVSRFFNGDLNTFGIDTSMLTAGADGKYRFTVGDFNLNGDRFDQSQYLVRTGGRRG